MEKMANHNEGGPARRQAMTEEVMARTGLSELMIRQLVEEFYRRIQNDAMLGPIFAERIDDWDAHLDKLTAFWSSVALMTGRYHGQPMPAHIVLDVDHSHFDHWLALFAATCNDICPPKATDHLMERARRIANSLEMGIAANRGRIQSPRF